MGILYLDAFNQRVMQKAFDDADVSFYPLFDAGVHVFVGENHPLAGRDIIKPEELTVWPRYSFEQGTANSFYYSEEPLSYVEHSRNIRISDRGTLSNLLTSYNGYTLSTGVLSSEMHTGIVSIPLDTGERGRDRSIAARMRASPARDAAHAKTPCKQNPVPRQTARGSIRSN